MPEDYDVIVAGLGAMGSAAAFHLASAGKRVLGLDQFQPPHERGSSHGLTRIIREAYFEHPAYVPLVQRAYTLWANLEKSAGHRLLLPTGGLMLGPPDGAVVRGARRSAEQHHLEHKVMTADEVRRRFPALNPSPDTIAIWEPRAGILFPELAIQSHLDLARQTGAVLQFHEPVLKWEPQGRGVRVLTPRDQYYAQRLLLSCGAWLNSLIPDLNLPLSVERQVMFWFEPRAQAEAFHPERCPIFIWEYRPQEYFYGFPDLGSGLKVAKHHQGVVIQPDQLRQEVAASEVEEMRQLLGAFLPNAAGPLRAAAVCMYTNTPDGHFILDHHPRVPHVLLASPCSGHGFKFSSAIGEVAALLISDQTPPLDLSLFRLARLIAPHL